MEASVDRETSEPPEISEIRRKFPNFLVGRSDSVIAYRNDTLQKTDRPNQNINNPSISFVTRRQRWLSIIRPRLK